MFIYIPIRGTNSKKQLLFNAHCPRNVFMNLLQDYGLKENCTLKCNNFQHMFNPKNQVFIFIICITKAQWQGFIEEIFPTLNSCL
jgi:hypothetical protein